MTAKKTDDKDVNEEDKGGVDADDHKDASGSGAGDGGLEHHVRELVKQAVDTLLGDRGESGGKRTQSTDEDELFRRVKTAQDRIKADEEKEGRLKTVEEKVEKVLEKPPARDGIAGKLQRFIWGSND